MVMNTFIVNAKFVQFLLTEEKNMHRYADTFRLLGYTRHGITMGKIVLINVLQSLKKIDVVEANNNSFTVKKMRPK